MVEQIQYNENESIKNELHNILQELQIIKEINININEQLQIQNEKLDNIVNINENNQQILINSSNNLRSINEDMKKDSSTKYAFISIITGAALLPFSIKVAIPIVISGLLFYKIKK